jgi:hypothetical protein
MEIQIWSHKSSTHYDGYLQVLLLTAPKLQQQHLPHKCTTAFTIPTAITTAVTTPTIITLTATTTACH